MLENFYFLRVEHNVCHFCHPNLPEQLKDATKHLTDRTGNWIGGYTTEKYAEWTKIKSDIANPLKVNCFVIDDCENIQVFLCKHHFEELVNDVRKELK